jgi:tripartite-type tricarboxylate transporter receptor subunit TctC
VPFVSGENYPNRPIRVVTAEAGGGSDVALRTITPGLASNLGQQVIVDNRGIIAAELVAKAPPDGYTLLFSGATLWVLPFLRDHVPYDPVGDFSAITLATRAANILVVHPSLPVKSVKELIALAKARPGELNYATSGAGNSVHLAGELFRNMTGVNIVRINYKGAAPALNDLIGGQIHLMFGVPGSVTQHVKSGRLRALAVTSAQPSALAPGLPTVAASVPGYESGSYLGFFAPAKTPAAVIDRLNRESVRVIQSADVKQKLFNTGIETVGSSAEALATLVKSDMAKTGKLLKDTGIRD